MFETVYGKKPVTLKGHWYIKNYGPDGQLKQQLDGENVITTVGLDFLASFLSSAAAGNSTFSMRYVAIGTDATAEAAANTALGIEVARHTGTVSYASSAIYRVSATFAAGTGTGAIVEYGLFSSSTGGTMMNRDTESVINKGAGDTLTVTTEITFA
jgi:hypothetical protein